MYVYLIGEKVNFDAGGERRRIANAFPNIGSAVLELCRPGTVPSWAAS
jgi:hypothetical protein